LKIFDLLDKGEDLFYTLDNLSTQDLLLLIKNLFRQEKSELEHVFQYFEVEKDIKTYADIQEFMLRSLIERGILSKLNHH
jgi:diacylglycerol kinase family enzyme